MEDEKNGLLLVPMKAATSVRVLGRTSEGREPLTLFWTASGLEFCIRAGELWIEFTSDYNLYEPWISIEINGAWAWKTNDYQRAELDMHFQGNEPRYH